MGPNRRLDARSVRRVGVPWGLSVALALMAGAPAAAAPLLLSDEALDSVVAGKLDMDVELSATADGASAMTSTTGSVAVGETTASRIVLDPTAPSEAQAKLLGASDVEVGIATADAQATGASHATCSASVAVSGADYVYTAQSQNFTAISATCSCTLVAVGFISH